MADQVELTEVEKDALVMAEGLYAQAMRKAQADQQRATQDRAALHSKWAKSIKTRANVDDKVELSFSFNENGVPSAHAVRSDSDEESAGPS